MRTFVQFSGFGWQLSLTLAIVSLLAIASVTSHAGGVVSGCSQQALENAIAGGGEVTFEEDCEITLTNTVQFLLSTTLDTSGFNVTIKSLFSSSQITVTNILKETNVVVSTNSICSTNFSNCITNFGTVTCSTNVVCTNFINAVTNFVFTTNVITSTTFTNGTRLFDVAADAEVSITGVRFDSGAGPNGGALLIRRGGSAFLTDCIFTNNYAIGTNGANGLDMPNDPNWGENGGPGGSGVTARGGAICNFGTLSVVQCLFQSNHVIGGSGGRGGKGGSGSLQGGRGGGGGSAGGGVGGAIYNGGTLFLQDSSFENNVAVGGNGGAGGTNGIAAFPGFMGIGGAAGPGSGAGLYSTQSVTIVNCTFANNIGQGGDSADGGQDSTGSGIAGPKGGDSFGGGVYIVDVGNRLTNCTFSANRVRGGAGGNGGNGGLESGNGGNGGDGRGGGLYNGGSINVINCTFADGRAIGGTNGVAGAGGFRGDDGVRGKSQGGNIANFGTFFRLKNSIIGTNFAGGGGFGTLTDSGNNISADKSLTFTAGSSKINTNPRLGPLADNGGPTRTMSLLSGSPAIDKGDDAAAPNFDQRGMPRPQGVQSDIGAVEVGSPAIVGQPQSQTKAAGETVTFKLSVIGDAPLTYTWQFNGSRIVGATTSTYSIANLAVSNSGNYRGIAANGFGSVTSSIATLKVVPPISTVTATQTNLSFQFPTAAGVNYVVQYTDSLTNAVWLPVATNVGTGGILTSKQSIMKNAQGFYRVVPQ